MRGRVSAIGTRYDAIEGLIEKLVGHMKDTRSGSYEDVPVSGAREEIDEALVGFFAAAHLDASAAELPSFVKLVTLLQRHSQQGHGGYRPPKAHTLRHKLPHTSASTEGDGFAATLGGGTTTHPQISTVEAMELH